MNVSALRFIGAGLVLLGVGIALFFLADQNIRVSSGEENENAISPTSTQRQVSSENDTDNDGLADWEERLWNTDPDDPDTDGDGTPDGEEVKNGRDPTVPGPDDEREEPLQTFARNISESFTVSGSSREENTAEQSREEKTPTQKLRKYGNRAGNILQAHLSVSRDLQVIDRVITNATSSEPVDTEPLSDPVTRYNTAAEQLTDLAVPEVASSAGSDLTAATQNIATSLAAVEDTNTYTEFVSALQKYNDAVLEWRTAADALRQLFDEHNISFNRIEGGSVFTPSL